MNKTILIILIVLSLFVFFRGGEEDKKIDLHQYKCITCEI